MNILNNIDDYLKKIPLSDIIGLKWIKLISAVLILLLVLFIIQISSSSQKIKFRYAEVIKDNFIVDIIESGDVEAYTQAVISAPFMWGTNLQIIDLISEGTLVNKGDVLIQFDVRDLKERKELAEDRIESLRADFEKLKSQQSLSIDQMENSVMLADYSSEQAELSLEMRQFESEALQQVAKIQLQRAENDFEMSQKQLESQKIIHRSQLLQKQIQVSQAENNLKSINERIERFCVRAPTNGMVVYSDVRGERIRKGYTARPGRPLMQIPDLSRMQVKFYINEMDKKKIKQSQKAVITLDAYPDVSFQGKIRNISRIAQVEDNKNWVKGFKVYADIEGADEKLKPGMTAKIRIMLEEVKDIVQVPVGAVFEIEGQPVVFPKGKTKPFAVYLGIKNNKSIEVKRGLKPGMQVSYISPVEKAEPLGADEERRRIASVNKSLRESFEVFSKHGILYDYKNEFLEDDDQETTENKVNTDKLPAFLQKRLDEGKRKDKSKPVIEVGESEKNLDKKTFKISPDMRKK